jgi:hypothetical protein
MSGAPRALLDRHGRPFLDAAGGRRAVTGPDDPSLSTAERAALLHERGEVMAAFEAAGVAFGPTPPKMKYSYFEFDPVQVLAGSPVAPATAECRKHAHAADFRSC